MKQKTLSKMKRGNFILSGILAFLGILTAVAKYYDVLFIVSLVVSLIFSIFVAFVVTMEVYNHDYEDNPKKWWGIYGGIVVTIFIIYILLDNYSKIPDVILAPFCYVMAIMIIPVFGIFLGMAARAITGKSN